MRSKTTIQTINKPINRLLMTNFGNINGICLPKALNLNVLPVYAKGITGRNVRVAVLDDGIEYDHEDLIQNYDPQISWNYNEDNADPYPKPDDDDSSHGTRCAGEIAMMANNKKCGVGIAFNSRIGCIKMLGGLVYDLLEGSSLGFGLDKVDIYSSSWGPMDNGQTMEAPGIFAKEALERGVALGRRGLGSIYVWASGNGRKKGDNCNCDGYAASIYTITVGSADDKGRGAWYSEKCASVMTVTYSSGNDSDQMITTTDVGNSCTVQHTGTSASAPLAAGIIALGLEANPNLSWRDVQHIIVRSATREPLTKGDDWQKNGAGLMYSTKLGFGLMDADAFVNLAQRWRTVPKQKIAKVNGSLIENPADALSNTKRIIFAYTAKTIRHLEHVQVIFTATCQCRGALEMYLSSPSGTQTTILDRRPRDFYADNCFDSWPFMSVATWSENPYGQWQLEIRDSSSMGNNIRSIGPVQLVLYGTTHAPSTT
ncbi:neuroendocrine convertase 1-like isoform X2 [Eupeodes corollae]|uniref:neuroendocrine convertase 1-like isoform X2 n=1 Tax=Eupeodes corollae TaxID=290404 RepID=UPI00249205B0|nr:neuroendocrine convertase 1-like isoform X2 [Eupeodes corollae]